jgi:hypothetical protein
LVAPVRHHEPCARIATAGDGHDRADGGLRAGLLPRLAVLAVAGQVPAARYDEAEVGVDDNLVIGRVPASTVQWNCPV